MIKMITLPKDDVEKQKVLGLIASKFELKKEYQESEVNKIIISVNVDDHVLIRRELVNFGYFSKDSYKGIYVLKKQNLSKEELDKISNNQKDIDTLCEHHFI
jgi:hypothetical protein